MEKEKIGRSIADKRGRYSRKEVAEYTGIPESTLASWERGDCLPDAKKMVDLAELYCCSLDELVGRK